MSKVTITRSNASRIVLGKALDKITRVRVIVGQDDDGNDLVYESGSGNSIFEVNNPMGNQAIADMILSELSLRGYQYRAFETTAIIDPAAEIGDTVLVNDSKSVIYSLDTDHSPLMISDAAAPYEEEINHEYKFETKQERQFKRQFKDVKATLSIQADRIEAKVEQTGGDNSSFGWSLLSDEFGLYSNGTKVFYVNATGAHVNGEITATSGLIGGFQIKSNSLSTNNATWSTPTANGIYIGPSGIKLGTKFSVDSAGNLRAESGTFTGNIKASQIIYGGDNGRLNADALQDYTIKSEKYFAGSVNESALGSDSVTEGKIYSGAVTNGKIGGGAVTDGKIYSGTITTGSLSSGINTSLYNADDAHGIAYSTSGYGYVSARFVTCTGNFYFQNHTCKWITIDGIPVISY